MDQSPSEESTAEHTEVVSPDHYATHLAKVNETQEVVSTEDVVNDRGVLICRKGARIDHGVADRLLKHKLAKPLDQQVEFTATLSGKALHHQLGGVLERFPDLQQVHQAKRFADDCLGLFVDRRLPPLLSQKLTVLHQRMPEELDKALFCAWLSGLIARELDMPPREQHAAFVAGLVHDVGFLHIDPGILNKAGALEAAEWRAIQSHVVVGQMMLESLAGVPERTARAVLEHHERCDGSGYPAGKAEEQLDLLGQIVGLADSVQSIRAHQFEARGRNLRDLLPYLQMNATTHFYDVYRAMCAILTDSGLRPTARNPEHDIASLARRLYQRGGALRNAVAMLTAPEQFELAANIRTRPMGQAVFRITQHVLLMTTQSGMVSDDLFQWLAALIDQPTEEALLELNEIELMQNELQWQLANALKVLEAFTGAGDDDVDAAKLQSRAQALGEALASLQQKQPGN